MWYVPKKVTHAFLKIYFIIIYLFTFVFCIFRATPAAYGGSQSRSLIGAMAASLPYSHNNARSEPRLLPTPQLMATPDP